MWFINILILIIILLLIVIIYFIFPLILNALAVIVVLFAIFCIGTIVLGYVANEKTIKYFNLRDKNRD